MRLYMTMRFDKPIGWDNYIITVGGFEVRTKDGKNYQFDFTDSTGYLNEEDETVMTFELRDEDYVAFPEISELRSHLIDTIELVECYVDIEGEPELTPVELLDFVIADSGSGTLSPVPESTEYITREVFQAADDYTINYTFTKKILDDFNNKVLQKAS